MERKNSINIDYKKCLGCTSCVKVCPVEAMRVHGKKAVINEHLCIDCGMCLGSCPHGAISSVPDSLSVIGNYSYKVALPDPSLFGQFTNIDNVDGVNLVLNGLLMIGFDDVIEPAAAAEMIAHYASVPELETKEKDFEGPYISSCCPAILRLIEIRFPNLIPNVVNTLTPMELAAIIARRKAVAETGYKPEEIGIIAIVPCSSQVTAARYPETLDHPVIDAAVSTRDIYTRLLAPMKSLRHEDITRLCHAGKAGYSHAYVGGEARARLAEDYLAVDGVNNCIRMLSDIEDGNIPSTDYVELNACVQGCVGGCLNVENPYSARLKLKHMEKNLKLFSDRNKLEGDDLNLIYSDKELEYIPVLLLDENRMAAIQKMNKIEELTKHLPGIDCGSCGCPSCRAFATDVVKGIANEEDCIFKVQQRLKKMVGSEHMEEVLPAAMRSYHHESEK